MHALPQTCRALIPLDLKREVTDTECNTIRLVARADRLLASMRAAPKADWKPKDVRVVVRAHGLAIRQRGTSHAVVTNSLGHDLTIPMHKPIKPVYIRRPVQLIEATG